MNYEELKDQIQKIVEISTAVPEPFQDKCFEILLTHLLREIEHPIRQPTIPYPKPEAISPVGESIPTPAQVRVFMQRNEVAQDTLQSVVMYINGDIHFIKEPSPPTIAEGQIQWALLLALKNGILSNTLQVDPEDVRSICQEKGFYDSPNFAAIFKRRANKKLFKGLLKPHGEPQQLSPEGEAELAKLIKSLAGASK